MHALMGHPLHALMGHPPEQLRLTCINVAGAIQRVEHDNVVAACCLLHSHGGCLLLTGNHTSAAAVAQAVAEDVVGDHIQLLLLLTLWMAECQKSRQANSL